MGHKCTSPHCKRRTGERCDTCRVGGGARLVLHDAAGRPVKPEGKRPHATPHEKGAAVDMYFDGLSYRKVAGNMETYFDRKTDAATVYRWVRELTGQADEILRPMKVNTGPTWVADEMVVNVGGEKLWLFNVMDSDTRFVLAAYLSPDRNLRAATTTLSLARERSATHPEEIKTDGLSSYRRALPRAFPTRVVKHTVSQGIRAEINNNMSERLQGTFRDRDKTLRGLKGRDTGQAYLDGLVLHYNYFRPHEALDDKRPAQAAGAELPFDDWSDVAAGKAVENKPAEATKSKEVSAMPKKITVYHGASRPFPDAEVGPSFPSFDDPYPFSEPGLWVSTDADSAGSFMNPDNDDPRVIILSIDPDTIRYCETDEEAAAAYESGAAAIGGAVCEADAIWIPRPDLASMRVEGRVSDTDEEAVAVKELTADEVAEIQDESGTPQHELARKYGVSIEAIRQAYKREIAYREKADYSGEWYFLEED